MSDIGTVTKVALYQGQHGTEVWVTRIVAIKELWTKGGTWRGSCPVLIGHEAVSERVMLYQGRDRAEIERLVRHNAPWSGYFRTSHECAQIGTANP